VELVEFVALAAERALEICEALLAAILKKTGASRRSHSRDDTCLPA
jgi:hypothetical protein